MSSERSRRDFLKTAALAGMGVWMADGSLAQPSKSPNEQIHFACIGVGGKGQGDSNNAGKFGKVVAICDVDDMKLAEAEARFPGAKKYNDFRVLLHEMNRDIDAVTVSTPDHTHAVAAAMAMRMGKHCFCQKPLTHNIFEARALGDIARLSKVATMMGNQGTATSGLRRAAAYVKAGGLGTVREVRVWTNRPVWPQGGFRPEPEAVPSSLHWDLWLGPAKFRPYSHGYHPFAWRGWWDFGTGALGDMACHTVNLPFMALDLRNPVSVEAHSAGSNKDSYAKWAEITFEFPATAQRPGVKMTWQDGGMHPPLEMLQGEPFNTSGSMMIGDKGTIYAPGDYGNEAHLLGGGDFGNVSFVESPGHFEEFVRAIKTGQPATSNFPDYAGPLTETILLGNLAVFAEGIKVMWDARAMRAKNAPEVADLVHPHYRSGYRL
jgi:predicted dehydrogenase